jgi:hypothetical protein
MPDSQPRPTLLQLPGEIRNNIYSHLLLSPTPVHIYRWRPRNNKDATPHRNNNNNNPPSSKSKRSLSTTLLPLLLTCRQTHCEATALFYSHNRFALPPSVLQHAPRQTQLNLLFRHFLDRIGPRNAALLRHLVIPFPEGYYFYGGDSSAVVVLVAALRLRCPGLKSIEFDLRWDEGAVMQLLVAAHGEPAAAVGGWLGDDRELDDDGELELDDDGRGVKVKVKVAVCLDPSGRLAEFREGEGPVGGDGRRRPRSLSPLSGRRWGRMKRVVEEGLGWRVVVRDSDQEEEEEEEEDALLEEILKEPEDSSSSDWYPREARDPRATVVWALSERVLQSEVHSPPWPGLEWARSGLQSVGEWLSSSARWARNRRAYEEYQNWRHRMVLHSIYVRYRWCNWDAWQAVPRPARSKRNTRGIFGFRRRRSDELRRPWPFRL